MRLLRRLCRATGVLLALALVAPGVTYAQGPLTTDFGEADPTTFAFRLGPVLASPGLTVREVGIDTNVFDEPVDPKRDFMATVTPDLSLFVRVGMVRVVAASAADFTYYREFEEERAISRQIRVRTDLLLGRLRPWGTAAYVQTRDRLNAELDRRAPRTSAEYGAGLGFEISPKTRVYVSGARTGTDFREGEVFQNVDLTEAFNRTSEQAQAGIEIGVTVFTTLTLTGGVQRDVFDGDPLRDSESRTAALAFEFSPEAVIRGRLRLGYRDFRPADPSLAPYEGLTASGGIAFTLLGTMRVEVGGSRDVEYSYEDEEGYFVQSGVDLSVTQRVYGPWDLQARAGRRWLDYTRPVESAASRTDRVDTVAAGIGYNLRDRSRIGLQWEYAERNAPLRPDRRYERQRIYGSWTYDF